MCPPAVRALCMLVAAVCHLFSSVSPAVAAPAPRAQHSRQQLQGGLPSQRARSQAELEPQPECRSLPANIVVQGNLERTLLQLMERSRTFRRQCGAIGMTPSVLVVVRLTGGLGSLVRARAEISSYADGATRALIEVPVSRDLPELLAHEFEHVIEHLDGVRFRTRACTDASVREVGRNAYESSRAIAAGQTAALEVDRFRAATRPR